MTGVSGRASIPPNPGGALQPAQVLGRNALIAEYWDALGTRSLALLAPRRVGKTSITVRMAADHPESFLVRRRDLEGMRSAPEFARALFEDVREQLGLWGRTATRAHLLLTKLLGTVEIKEFKLEVAELNWKRLIEQLFEDLDEQLGEQGKTLVLMWDEFTLFVGDLVLDNRATEAMALLDTLRGIRQARTNIRMLFTGSVGIHEVLRRLKDRGYRNSPFNDIATRNVPMLDIAGAEELVTALFRFTKTPLDPELIAEVVRCSEGHPFVIQHLVDQLRRIHEPRAENVQATLQAFLQPPDDPLQLHHYVERLDSYYDAGEAELARRVLDLVAQAPGGLGTPSIFEHLADNDRDTVLEVVRHLEQDFYLQRDGRQVRFVLEFVRQFWFEERAVTGPVHSRFSPRAIPGEQLDRMTVGREALLGRLELDVANAVQAGQARFDLLLGPRGAGKSHTIGVLEHRLSANSEFCESAVLVSLPEENHPTSLLHLLALVLRAMPVDADIGPVEASIRNLARNPDEGEERAVGMIAARLGGRALILILENLDELFEAIGTGGQGRLRNILQTRRNWSVLATARARIPAFNHHDAPFHGTFNFHGLENFSAEECREMLARLAIENQADALATVMRSPLGLARIRGIRHILGGSPRAMAFIYRHLDIERLDHFEQALWELAEELTPYFQEQMTRLSPAQRAVMEVLSERQSPLSVGEIAESIFSSEPSTSGTLRTLFRDGLVAKMKVGRECYYEIADPLHRIARATKQPRGLALTLGRVVRSWFALDDAATYNLRRRFQLPSISVGVASEISNVDFRITAEFFTAITSHGAVGGRAFLGGCAPDGNVIRVLGLLMNWLEGDVVDFDDFLPSMNQEEESLLLSTSILYGNLGLSDLNLGMREWARSAKQICEYFDGGAPPPVAPSQPLAKTLASRFIWRQHLLADAAFTRRFDDVAELFEWIAPPPMLPSIEIDLVDICDRAWHFGQLTSLRVGLGRLLSSDTQWTQRSAFMMLMASSMSGEKPVDGFAGSMVRSLMNYGELPSGEFGEVTSIMVMALAGLVSEWFSSFDEIQLDQLPLEGEHLILFQGAISRIAARRGFGPTRALHAHLCKRLGTNPLPFEPGFEDPAAAFARLPAPLRDLVRQRLVALDDQDGLRFFNLE